MTNEFEVPDFNRYKHLGRIYGGDMVYLRDVYISEMIKYYRFIHNWFMWIVDLNEIDIKRIGLVVKCRQNNIEEISVLPDGSNRRNWIVYAQPLYHDNKIYYSCTTGFSTYVSVPNMFINQTMVN